MTYLFIKINRYVGLDMSTCRWITDTSELQAVMVVARRAIFNEEQNLEYDVERQDDEEGWHLYVTRSRKVIRGRSVR